MGESFKKLKRKTLTATILKSVTVGLSLGIFVVGALLLAFKLGKVNFHWALYIPIGLGVALIAGGLFFFFTRPTDKKIAIKYDAEYGFNEKLQTMVEFGAKGIEGDVITLQREDALERLSNAPALKVRFSRIWYFFLIAAIAVAIFFTGVLIPRATQKSSDSEPPPVIIIPPDDPIVDPDAFEYTLAMQSSMDDLINAVRDFELEEDFKKTAVDRLTALNKALLKIKSKNDMYNAVLNAVKDIDDFIYATNSFRTLSSDLSETDEELSKGIKQSFVEYKGRITNDMHENYVKALRGEIGNYIEDTLEAYVEASATKLKVSQLPTDGSKNLEDTLTEYTDSLNGALTLTVIEETDPLYDSYKKLYTSLRAIRRQVQQGGTTDSVLWDRMDENFKIFQKNAVEALSVQSYKCIVEIFVRQGLEKIFSIEFPEDDGFKEMYHEIIYTPGDAPGTGDTPGTGNGSGGGGAGTGDIVYGSDDEIYDPRTGEKVKFGVVLKEYENAIMNGTAEEDFPPELAKYLETYLNYLHNGTGKTNN